MTRIVLNNLWASADKSNMTASSGSADNSNRRPCLSAVYYLAMGVIMGKNGGKGLRQNCWEVMACGREPGGLKVAELGVCPATVDSTSDGVNDGKNAGRICWAVAGTLCGGAVEGTFAQKQITCMTCEFFQRVFKEQRHAKFQLLKNGQRIEIKEEVK